MGFGEYDRNCNPYLMRVQTDFHKYKDESGEEISTKPPASLSPSFSAVHHSSTNSVSDSKSKQEFETVFLRVPATARLKKGYGRVSLLFSPEDNPGVYNGDYHCYDIVLHNDEAYLIEINIDRCPAVREQLTQVQYRVADYSAGWKHSLIIVEPIP